MCLADSCSLFFFFNDTATTEIYTLSLHDALPISHMTHQVAHDLRIGLAVEAIVVGSRRAEEDRKSTRLNSSHSQISYAVFCLKKKKQRECANRVAANLSAILHRPADYACPSLLRS